MSKPRSSSIDNSEIDKFSRIADEWWDLSGKFGPLHKLNPVRVAYITAVAESKMVKHSSGRGAHIKGVTDTKPLQPVPFTNNPTILDIGCGGGLLCEPLRKLGANVTGIDASEENIRAARAHAQKSGLDIKYLCTSAEELAATGVQFDIVLNMEVIEHVADVPGFMEASCKMVKPGGKIFIATLNRTLKSFAFAIVGAEYVLNWLPRGTHNWEKFLKPSEINTHLEKNDMALMEIKGVSFNLLKNKLQLSDDIAVNYMMYAVKN